MRYTERVRAAMRFAEHAHRGQFRKGSDSAYLLHPVAVAALLVASAADEDVVCAAYLHDVVEDAAVEVDDLRTAFGDAVAELVSAVTEDKRRSWRERKGATIAHLASASQQELALKGADVCANIADVVLDHAFAGDAVWERFRRGADDQVWYYGAVADAVLARLEGHAPLRDELTARLAELRALPRPVTRP